MFDNCKTVREVLKRFLEISKEENNPTKQALLLEIASNRIITQFSDQIGAEVYRNHKAEGISALEVKSEAYNPLLGKKYGN